MVQPTAEAWGAHSAEAASYEDHIRLLREVSRQVASSIVHPIADCQAAYVFLANHGTRGWEDTTFIDALAFRYERSAPGAPTIVRLQTSAGARAPAGDGVPYVEYDADLDASGPTFDDALVALANLVYAKYGTGWT